MLVFNLISRYIRIRKTAPVLFKQQARQQASFRSGYSSSSQNPYFSVIYFFLRLQNVLVLTYFQFLAKMVYPGGSESHFSFCHAQNSNSNLFSPTLLFLFCVPVYACKLLQCRLRQLHFSCKPTQQSSNPAPDSDPRKKDPEKSNRFSDQQSDPLLCPQHTYYNN